MVALNAALADVAVETSATQTQLTWIVDGYTLALACLLLPAGAIGDRFGRRGALLAGLLIFTAASAAPIIWDEPWEIVAARAVAGAGAAFIMPATLSLLTSATHLRNATRRSASGQVSPGQAPSSGSLVPACCWPSSPGSRFFSTGSPVPV